MGGAYGLNKKEEAAQVRSSGVPVSLHLACPLGRLSGEALEAGTLGFWQWDSSVNPQAFCFCVIVLSITWTQKHSHPESSKPHPGEEVASAGTAPPLGHQEPRESKGLSGSSGQPRTGGNRRGSPIRADGGGWGLCGPPRGGGTEENRKAEALREKTGHRDKEDGEPKTKPVREEEEEGEKPWELRLRNYDQGDEDLKGGGCREPSQLGCKRS